MDTRKIRQIALHLLGCILFLTLPFLFSPEPIFDEMKFQKPFFWRDFTNYVLLIIFFYLNYFLFIPRLYFKRKYVAYFLVIFLCFVVNFFLPKLWLIHFEMHPHPMDDGRPRPNFIFFDIGHIIFVYSGVILLSLILRINAQWKQAQREKAHAELSYLKAQINPHFLFNTLNSIYSLAITQSDKTASSIVKLSGMMRYVLFDAQSNLVSLEKEINYITDYVDLQKLRFDDTVNLIFEVRGEPSGKVIAPLIIISFIENAFKYGISPEEKSDIVIDIDIDEQDIKVYIQNNKVKTKFDSETGKGVGIENTRNRLEMIYPGKYELSLEDERDTYIVYLKIELV